MAGFWYFVPRTSITDLTASGRLRPAALASVGLAQILADCLAVPQQTIALELPDGPGGTPGVLLYPRPVGDDSLPRLGFDPGVQTWHAQGDGSSYWIGYLTDDPPHPTDLERTEQIAGYSVADGYADRWTIPIARAVDNPRGNLPYAVRWNERGRPVCAPSARYAAFWQASGRLWDLISDKCRVNAGNFLLIGAGLTADDETFLLDILVEAITINYRVDSSVLAIYDRCRPGWLTQTSASLAVNAICDMCGKLAWEAAKKKAPTSAEPAGTSTGPGAPDATPDTAPAAES